MSNIEAFRSKYGSGLDELIIGEWGGGSLSNGGEVITLTDNKGLMVFSFSYNDSSPWPESPDKDGTSLTLLDPNAGGLSNPLNWTSSISVGGSPGGVEKVSAFLNCLNDREEIDPLAVKKGETVNNFLTYAFGLDLIEIDNEDAVPSPSSVIIDGKEYLSLKFLQRNSDKALQYKIQLSEDGKNWIDANDQMQTVSEVYLEDVVKVLTVRMKDELGSIGKTFLRVVVQYN